MSIITSRRPDLRHALFVVAVLLGSGAALAQDRGTQADQDACTPDVFRLCNDYIPDEPQIVACLQSKRTQLSPACGKVFTPVPGHRKHHREG